MKPNPQHGFSEILLYTTPNGQVKVEMYLQNENIWKTKKTLTSLRGFYIL